MRGLRLAPRRSARRRALRGSSLLEALVALVVVALGVLGFIGLQARSAVDGAEGQQRALALQLVQDMAQRMSLNRLGTRAGYYVRSDLGVNETCTPPPIPAGLVAGSAQAGAHALAVADLCAWHAQIRATLGLPGGTLARVRGCISATDRPDEFQVALVWQGLRPSGPGPLACGQGDASAFPDDSLRRGAATVLRLGRLL